MRIHAELHCQNMQKNTTLQENDLKIPAKFGMRMGGGTDISLGLTAAEVGDLIKVKSVDENGKPTAWERVETIDGTLTEASDNSLGITSATVGQIAKITAIDDNGKPTEWIGTKLAQEIKANNYPITITESTELTGYNGGPAYLPDKEIEEIETAYASGANLYVVYEGMTVPLTGVSADDFAFSGFLPTGEGMSFRIYRGEHSAEYRAARDVYNTGILNQLKTDYGPYIVQEDSTGEKLSMTVPVPAESDKGKMLEANEYGSWEIVDMPTVSDDYELVYQETIAEDVASYTRDTDKDGKPFSLTDVMVIIFTKPFAESTNSAGRRLGFLPTSRWGKDCVSCDIGNSISSANNNYVGRYNVVFVKVVNGYQVVTRAYISQNSTNVFGNLMRQTAAGNEMFRFHTDATKLMQIDGPQGNMTCVKIVGYTNPLVSAGTIIALYKKKGT